MNRNDRDGFLNDTDINAQRRHRRRGTERDEAAEAPYRRPVTPETEEKKIDFRKPADPEEEKVDFRKPIMPVTEEPKAAESAGEEPADGITSGDTRPFMTSSI